MRKALTVIARLIAVVLVVSFVITAVLALLLANASWHLLGPELYKQALKEQRIYERLPKLASEQIVRSFSYNPCVENPDSEECLAEGGEDAGEPGDGGGAPPFMQNLTPRDYEIILSTLLPPPWLQAQVEGVIDQLFAYLDSNAPELSLKVSLVELKQRFASDEGLRALEQILQAQPPCTEEQLETLNGLETEGLEPGDDPQTLIPNVPLCNPPEGTLEQYGPQIQRELGEVAAGIPDEVDLAEAAMGTATPIEESGPFGDDPRFLIQAVRWGARLSPLLPLALLMLATAFGVRSWKGWLRWWGIPFLVVGLIDVAIAVAALPLMNWAIAAYVMPRIPGVLTGDLVEVGLGVVRLVAGTVATWIGVEAGILGLLGLVMIVISLFIRKKSDRQQPAASDQPPAISSLEPMPIIQELGPGPDEDTSDQAP